MPLRLPIICSLCLILLVLTACDRLTQLSDRRNIEVADQLSRLQIAILEDAGLATESEEDSQTEAVVSVANHAAADSQPADTPVRQARIAVLTVVDQSLFPKEESEEESEEDAALQQTARQSAQRRERQIRQAINARLVRNSMICVVQPSAENLASARAELIANDSAPLSQLGAATLGELLGVDYIVNVLIDREGQDVDVVAQHTADGAIVFQETRNWTGRLRLAEHSSQNN